MLGFFSCPIRSTEIILPKYGLRELKASPLKQVANNEFFKSLTVLQVHPQLHSICWAILLEHNKQAKTFTFTGSGADKCVVICAHYSPWSVRIISPANTFQKKKKLCGCYKVLFRLRVHWKTCYTERSLCIISFNIKIATFQNYQVEKRVA